ncbi:hypothetical protein AS149_31785 [Burkholderia cenocepacia]|nr:hypothetical protein AS149_31785 [Burkholderia cenocepacia]
MVRNFKMLVAAVGADNLAIALEMPDKRIAAIESGDFTVETAHYIETTLGLPGGFIGQVNPKLTDEIIARLKSPLESKIAEAEEEQVLVANEATASNPEPAQPQLRLVPNTQTNDAAPAEVVEQVQTVQPQESDMAKSAAAKKAAGSSSAAKTAAKAPAAAQQSLLDTEGGDVMAVRRANLNLLTERLGSKNIVCALTNMSSANLSHRLTGLKKFDDAEEQRFQSALQLPKNWLDTPHTVDDIPSKVFALLDPEGVNAALRPPGASNRESSKSKATKDAAKAPATKTPAGKKVAAKKTIKPRERILAPADVSAPRLSASVLGRKAASESATPAPAAAPAPAPAPAPAAATRKASPAPSSTPSATREASTTATAIAEAPAAARQEPSALTSAALASTAQPAFLPEEFKDVQPIAWALLRTLAIKVRDNRVDEFKAHEMLTDIMKL